MTFGIMVMTLMVVIVRFALGVVMHRAAAANGDDVEGLALDGDLARFLEGGVIDQVQLARQRVGHHDIGAGNRETRPRIAPVAIYRMGLGYGQ